MGVEVDDNSVAGTLRADETHAISDIDPELADAILAQIVGADADVRKDAAVRALLAFTWEQRLYFIVRSALMGVLGATATGAIVLLFGEVNAIQVAVISAAAFVATLALTRLLDKWLNGISRDIISSMSRHRRMRSFIVKHF